MRTEDVAKTDNERSRTRSPRGYLCFCWALLWRVGCFLLAAFSLLGRTSLAYDRDLYDMIKDK